MLVRVDFCAVFVFILAEEQTSSLFHRMADSNTPLDSEEEEAETIRSSDESDINEEDNQSLHEIRTFHESAAKIRVFKDSSSKMQPITVSLVWNQQMTIEG